MKLLGRRAAASIATLLVAMLLISTFTTAMLYIMQRQQGAFTGGEQQDILDKAKEDLEVVLEYESGGVFHVKVKNTGSITVRLIQLLATKADGALETVNIDPPETLIVLEERTLTVAYGGEYVGLGLLTERGNIFPVKTGGETPPPLPQNYTVCFQETGLPENTPWSVTFNSTLYENNPGEPSIVGPITVPPGTYEWSVEDPIYVGDDARYEAQAKSGEVTIVDADKTVYITYNGYFMLRIAAVPEGSGTITLNPLSGDGFYEKDAGVEATINVNEGYLFHHWELDGAYAGSESSRTVIMNTPHTLLAFNGEEEPDTATVRFIVDGMSGDASGTVLTVDGTHNYGYNELPKEFEWEINSQHAFEWRDPVGAGSGKQYVWFDTVGLSTSRSGQISVPEGGGQIAASYKTQYRLTMVASPSTYGSTSPSEGSHWYYAGSLVTISATPYEGYMFTGWGGVGSGSYTGTDNPATITMNAPITETAGFYGSSKVTFHAPGLDGSLIFGGDDYVEIPDSSSLRPTNQITIAMWLKLSYWSDSHILSKREAWYDNKGYFVRTDTPSDTLTLVLGNGAGEVYSAAVSIDANKWMYIVGTYDGDKVRVYKDGAEWGSGVSFTGPIVYDSNVDLVIGKRFDQYGAKGFVDGLQICGRAWTQEEIRYNMNHGTPLQSDLALWFSMNEGSGSTVHDQSGNGNDGTVYDAAWVPHASSSETVLTVDGSNYVYFDLPKTFEWDINSPHGFTWHTPIGAGTGKQYEWKFTSGLSTLLSGEVTALLGGGYVRGDYEAQYYLIMQVSPGGSGSVSPGNDWYKAGEDVDISANPSPCYMFKEWVGSGLGSYTGTDSSATITMNGPITETACFGLSETTVTFSVSGMGSDVSSSEWLTGWGYRKSHIIHPVSGAGINYQVKITVHKDGGMDSGKDVYLSNHIYNWPNDIRFTDDDGVTLLDYWVESSGSSTATFWVEVKDSLSTDDVTIYIYYDKSGASSASNGDNTFPFFDDFSGAYLATNKWTQLGDVSVGGGVCQIGGGSEHSYIKGKTSFGTGYCLRSRSKATDNDAMLAAFDNMAEDFIQIRIYQGGIYGCGNTKFWHAVQDGGGAHRSYQCRTPIDADYHITEIKWVSSSLVVTSIDDTTLTFTTADVPDGDHLLPPLHRAMCQFTAGTKEVVDWTFVRKYVDPEPAHGGWGVEETPQSSGIILTVDGEKYNYGDLPKVFSWELDSTHSFEWHDPVGAGSGKRYRWDSTTSSPSDLAPSERSGQISVPEGGGEVIGNYEAQYYLTMQANPSDGGSVSPSSGWYDAGSSVTISATPYSGYTFTGWTGFGDGSYTGTGTGADHHTTITMSGPITETADFEEIGQYTLTIQVNNLDWGTTDPEPGGYPYDSGTSVSVTAFPNEGCSFDHWELDGEDVGSANPYMVTMDSDHILGAVFQGPTPGVTFSVSDMGSDVSSSEWLTGWGYRKSHRIYHSSGAGTNYQVKIIVHKGSGTDSGENVYLNNHVYNWPSDIRFTDNDGTTLLDYWVESSGSSTATFWVEVKDSLSSNDVTIFIYYGKSGVGSASGGDSVFLFFDDFLGSSVDTSKWDILNIKTGGTSVSGGCIHFETGTDSYAFGRVKWHTHPLPLEYNILIHIRFMAVRHGGPGSLDFYQQSELREGIDYAVAHMSHRDGDGDERANRYAGGAWETEQMIYPNPPLNTWLRHEEIFVRTSSTYTKLRLLSDSGAELGSYTYNGWNPTVRRDEIGSRSASSNPSNTKSKVDYYYVRKYVDPEPTHGGWGIEETSVGVVLTVDSIDYKRSDLPKTFSDWAVGSEHSFEWHSPVAAGPGKKYVWTSTTGGLTTARSGTITVPDHDAEVQGNYEAQYCLTMVANPGTYGYVSPSPGWYDAGSSVTITATPYSGYKFTGWTGFGGGSYTGLWSSKTITINNAITEIANFEKKEIEQYTLTIQVNDDTWGTTTPSPGDYLLDAGTEQEALASAYEDYDFDYWKLDGVNVGSDNPYTVIMDSDHTLKAFFREKESDVTFKVSGMSGDTGNEVVLTVDYVDYKRSQLPKTFSDWVVGSSHNFEWHTPVYSTTGGKRYKWQSTSGLSTSRSGTIRVPENGGTVQGNYKTQYRLIIQVNNENWGYTSPNTGEYWKDSGSSVSVTAYPYTGYELDHWELDGSNVGQNNPYTVYMYDPHTLKAVFGTPEVEITFEIVDVETDANNENILKVDGTWYKRSQLPKIFDTWTVGSSHSFEWKANVLLDTDSGVPGNDKKYVWVSTTGGLSTERSGSITVPGYDADVKGNYKTQYKLTTQVNDDTWGTTDPSPGNYWYDSGTSVPVTANPESGYKLDYWELDGSNAGFNNPIYVTMNSPHVIKAFFRGDLSAVTFKVSGMSTDTGDKTVLTVDSVGYKRSDIPTSGLTFYWSVGSEHTFQWESNDILLDTVSYVPGEDKKYDFVSSSESSPITVPEEDTSVTGYYDTYYNLYTSEHPDEANFIVERSHWLKEGTEQKVEISVVSPPPHPPYVFHHWGLDGVGQGNYKDRRVEKGSWPIEGQPSDNPIYVTMDSPHHLKAICFIRLKIYVTDYEEYSISGVTVYTEYLDVREDTDGGGCTYFYMKHINDVVFGVPDKVDAFGHVDLGFLEWSDGMTAWERILCISEPSEFRVKYQTPVLLEYGWVPKMGQYQDVNAFYAHHWGGTEIRFTAEGRVKSAHGNYPVDVNVKADFYWYYEEANPDLHHETPTDKTDGSGYFGCVHSERDYITRYKMVDTSAPDTRCCVTVDDRRYKCVNPWEGDFYYDGSY